MFNSAISRLLQQLRGNGITLQSTPVTSTAAVSTSPRAVNVNVVTGTNTVLVVVVQYAGNGAGAGSVSGITFDSVALTKIDAQPNATWGGVEMWRLKTPNVGLKSLSVSMAANSGNYIFGAYVLDNVDQTTIHRTPAKSTAATGTSVSNTVSSVVSTDYIIDGLSVDNTSHAVVPSAAGQAERWDIETVAADTTGASSYKPNPANGTMSWTWTTTKPNSHLAVAFILASPAPPSGVQQLLTMMGVGA